MNNWTQPLSKDQTTLFRNSFKTNQIQAEAKQHSHNLSGPQQAQDQTKKQKRTSKADENAVWVKMEEVRRKQEQSEGEEEEEEGEFNTVLMKTTAQQNQSKAESDPKLKSEPVTQSPTAAEAEPSRHSSPASDTDSLWHWRDQTYFF